MSTELSFNERNYTLPAQVCGRIDVYSTDSTPKYWPGTRYVGENNKVWRYAWAGATGLSRAYMHQGEAPAASYLVDQVQTGYGATAGATTFKVLVTTGSGIDATHLIGGTLVVEELGTGDIGDIYTIGNASWYSGDTVLTITTLKPIRNTIAATAKLTIIKNPYMDTIVVPTSGQTALAVGVPLVDVTAKYGYWTQTQGIAPLFVDTGDTIVVGQPVGLPASSAVAGACGPVTIDPTLTAVTQVPATWGNAVQVGAASKVALVNLSLE